MDGNDVLFGDFAGIRMGMMYSRNLSAPAFAADFPPDAHKFNPRTPHKFVRI